MENDFGDSLGGKDPEIAPTSEDNEEAGNAHNSFNEGETGNEQTGTRPDSEIQPLDSRGQRDAEVVASAAAPHEADNSSIRCLYAILSKVKCPILETSFFSASDVSKMLPQDRLTLTRNVLLALNQCANFWKGLNGEPRLSWFSLENHDFEDLVVLLSKNQGIRLSLTGADLNQMKTLPVFQTLSGSRVSLQSGNENYILDESVDIQRLSEYLPGSLRSRFLVEKPCLSEILQDLGVKRLSEADILKNFVLPEFPVLPILQQEAVCEVVLNKWGTLSSSAEFVSILKETPFVKRATARDGEIVFVKANQLYDPRNEFLDSMLEDDPTNFPAEEFLRPEWLDILSAVGIKDEVDKDTFLKCAWIVESENSTSKAMKLFEYYKENFADFFDQEFSRQLADVKCVPAKLEDEPLSLHRFREVAVPRDRNVVFKVFPVMPETITPPQVMFSSLGIVSPPTIPTVLDQVRLLTEDESALDRWSYKHGTIEEVFADLFSFLQENFRRLARPVQAGLRDLPLVPVGTTLVRANRLFFRLNKDLSPFFYEVPRAFGAYDELLRNLGVRESPQSNDYALSLAELKREIGVGMLNVNELNSAIDVVSLIADEESMGKSLKSDVKYAPDSFGKLVNVTELLQNDCPWLINSGRLDLNRVFLVHPKLSRDLCEKLGIQRLSECITEVLEESFVLTESERDVKLIQIEANLRSAEFISTVEGLTDMALRSFARNLEDISVRRVKSLRTCFILSRPGQRRGVDITLDKTGTFSFAHEDTVWVSDLPMGVTSELVVATTITDYFRIDRKHVAGLSAMLAAEPSGINVIGRAMGIGTRNDYEELRRGEPGFPLVKADLDLVEIKPLKIFSRGEIVAMKDPKDSSSLIYAVVLQRGGGNSLSRLRLRIDKEKEVDMLSSEIMALRGGTKSNRRTVGKPVSVDLGKFTKSSGLLQPYKEKILDAESALVVDRETDSGPRGVVAPVDRHEVISAVEDLLQSASLSLDGEAKKVMESYLEVRDQLSQKDVLIESLTNEGKNLAKDLSKGIDAFLCPITREVMADPVICADGHTYERAAIQQWLRSNSRSPKTNRRLQSQELIPNHTLRSTIESMTEGMNAVKRFTNAYN